MSAPRKVMSTRFTDYTEAAAFARHKADSLKLTVGILRSKEYGKDGYSVFLIPTDPTKRFDRDARCEVVEPTR